MFHGSLFIVEVSIVILIAIESIIEATQHTGLGRLYWLTCAFMSLSGTIVAACILLFPPEYFGSIGYPYSVMQLARTALQLVCAGTLLSLIGVISLSIKRRRRKHK